MFCFLCFMVGTVIGSIAGTFLAYKNEISGQKEVVKYIYIDSSSNEEHLKESEEDIIKQFNAI